MRPASVAAYIAVGAAFHVAFVGAAFDPFSLLTWAWLLGWPLMLFVIGMILMFAAVLTLTIGVLAAVFACISVTALISAWGDA